MNNNDPIEGEASASQSEQTEEDQQSGGQAGGPSVGTGGQAVGTVQGSGQPSNSVKPLNRKQLQFADWLTLPPWEREPAEQQQLAVILKTAPETLTRWKKLPALSQYVWEQTRQNLKAGDLSNILAAQTRLAQSDLPHSVSAARFVFEAAGLLSKDGQSVNVSGDGAKVLVVSRDGLDLGI